METITPHKHTGRKFILILSFTVIIIFITYYTVMMTFSPVRKLKAIKDEFGLVPNGKNSTEDGIIYDSTFLSLMKEKSILQSRIAMAETDSVYLTINLADSVLDLEISGVTVHTAKISRESISRILARNENEIFSLLSRPFTISNNYSSIKKEPLMIKMAPKDTSEFQPDIIPDTADFEPVNFIFQTDNGTRILVYQEEKIRHGDGRRLFMFDLAFRIRDLVSSLKSVISFKIPEYHPYIKIRIRRSDAKIIFRAMPEHGQIAIYR